MIPAPVLLGNYPPLLKEVRRLFHAAREAGEFDPQRTEPTGAEWIVYDGKPMKGFALFSYAGPGMAAIEPVYVLPEYRKQGIAEALIRVAVAGAELHGFKHVILGLENEKATMRKLTGSLGFREAGVITMKEVA